jgi:hypothetical protein
MRETLQLIGKDSPFLANQRYTNLAEPEPTGIAVFLNAPNSHLYFTFFGVFGLCVHCTEYLCIPRVSSDFL